jgi:hypothetical protein
MPDQARNYSVLAVLLYGLYPLFSKPRTSSPASNTTPGAILTATATATATWNGDTRSINVEGTLVAKTEAMIFAEIIVKQARHRRRMMGVCTGGSCEKRWVVSA